MTILVTGSSGHLGEALMRRLRAEGTAVRGVDIKPSSFTDIVGSITDPAVVERAMAGVAVVFHVATLHKPHVATHPPGDFVDTNINGTLALLERAVANKVSAFVFTSTTSAFGAALTAGQDEAAWITEDVHPVPKNIYGVTKVAAEDMCELYHRKRGLPVVVLRTSRFFPEDDDDPAKRAAYALANMQAMELLYRRVDIADVVDAHLLASTRAHAIGFDRFIVSATTPFKRGEARVLRYHLPTAVAAHFPDAATLFEAHGWRLLQGIDRVYDNVRARELLGWKPKHDFAHALDQLRAGADFRSEMAIAVGVKGYHDTTFDEGPYPVDAPH
ncbi:NAD-dependent epimerase/dehydratase family protein [Pinirhizobacter soli]|uniref:NAD-dependent epimerase/dehydratase family protein n=1 Tax=Pinirhizobacter soli TaxID=2786953 RepID=UPI00202A0E74|nr:NAD(P)-dependent oxidoreductase [Pinirhizobacter soli]